MVFFGPLRILTAGFFLLLPLVVSAGAVEVVSPGSVVFQDGSVERPLTNKPGDPVAGEKWLTGRKAGNCLACHSIEKLSKHPYHGEVGPALDGIASVRTEGRLRATLINPKRVLGSQTIMPAFYRLGGLQRSAPAFVGKTILTAQQVEDVLAYLLTLKWEE